MSHYKSIPVEFHPKTDGWYNTDKGKLYFFTSDNEWSCREDKISSEYPEVWYQPISKVQELIEKWEKENSKLEDEMADFKTNEEILKENLTDIQYDHLKDEYSSVWRNILESMRQSNLQCARKALELAAENLDSEYTYAYSSESNHCERLENDIKNTDLSFIK